MADVRPFRSLRYNLERVSEPSAVICPPYDVISAEEQPLYYRRSPYNAIRLEFGLCQPDDSAVNNRYTRAAHTLQEWLKEGILVKEGQPAFYILEHRFPYDSGEKSRWGLLARVRLEPWGRGAIRPHEVTMKGPAEDRLHLLEVCCANFSPIMGIFRDKGPEGPFLASFAAGSPTFTAMDNYGVTFRVWVRSDALCLSEIRRFLADKVIYIADGHHRYETALYYKEQRRAQGPSSGEEPFHFILMSLSASNDPGLLVLPTHRLLQGLEKRKLGRLRKALEAFPFAAEVLPRQPTLSETAKVWLEALRDGGQSRPTFGLYGLHGDSLCLVGVQDEVALQKDMPPGEPPAWQELDVSLLHWTILRKLLGLDSPAKEKSHLQFTRDALEAIVRVDSGNCQLAFLLNCTNLQQVLDVADAGSRMPQKSTYFYPKTPAGLVINSLCED